MGGVRVNLRKHAQGKPTQEYVRSIFIYDRDTGALIRRKKTNRSTVVGEDAGCIDSCGYKRVCVLGIDYKVHRLIWLYEYGYFPENQIDHINRIRTDNRLCNLREVTQSCNSINAGRMSNNTSGVKGVSLFKGRRWRAHIKINGIYFSVGFSDDFTEAVAHRLAAEQCLGWDSCNSESDAKVHMKKVINNGRS